MEWSAVESIQESRSNEFQLHPKCGVYDVAVRKLVWLEVRDGLMWLSKSTLDFYDAVESGSDHFKPLRAPSSFPVFHFSPLQPQLQTPHYLPK